MAKKTIKSAALLAKDRTNLNANFTELYTLLGSTTALELAAIHDAPASITMTSTPATGTCAVQLTFKNAAGAAISHIHCGKMFTSSSAGAYSTAVTSYAVLTNGGIDTEVTGKQANIQTTAAGLLGITVTASAGTYYLSFVMPNGKLVTTGAIVVN